jgi:hypothetical protein
MNKKHLKNGIQGLKTQSQIIRRLYILKWVWLGARNLQKFRSGSIGNRTIYYGKTLTTAVSIVMFYNAKYFGRSNTSPCPGPGHPRGAGASGWVQAMDRGSTFAALRALKMP